MGRVSAQAVLNYCCAVYHALGAHLRGEVLWPHACFGSMLFQFNSELPDKPS
jgi:hypothetical protein